MSADFENELQRRPLREIPREWRAEILAAAAPAPVLHGERTARKHAGQPAVVPSRPRVPCSAPPPNTLSRPKPGSLLLAARNAISSWLWPHPRAWAGLGVAWLVILGLNAASGNSATQAATASALGSRQTLVEVREQRQLLARLIFPPTDLDAEPARPADPRRSEIGRTLMSA